MKYLKFLLILPVFCLSCISMLETAKIDEGMSYGFDVGYTRIRSREVGWKVEEQVKDTYGLNLRIKKGMVFTTNKSIGIELGTDLGMIIYPSVLGVTEYNSDESKYEICYYPYELDLMFVPTYFIKIGILQNERTSFAVKVNMAGDKFGSAAVIASKTYGEKEIYAGARLFNRFIKSPEKTMFEGNYGQYFCAGVEIPTTIRILNSTKFYHYSIEFGIVNNIWYEDKPTIRLSLGLSIK